MVRKGRKTEVYSIIYIKSAKAWFISRTSDMVCTMKVLLNKPLKKTELSNIYAHCVIANCAILLANYKLVVVVNCCPLCSNANFIIFYFP